MALILAACAGNSEGNEEENPTEAGADTDRPQVIVTQDDHPEPPSCRPRRVAGFVVGFVVAFNAGDDERLAGFLANEGFEWYGVEGGAKDPPDFAGREATLTYFADRHDHGERLRLRAIRVNIAGMSSDLGLTEIEPAPVAAVEFFLVRMADDFGEGSPLQYHGKAWLNCQDRTILHWVMGPENEGLERLCPRPATRPSGRAVIACG